MTDKHNISADYDGNDYAIMNLKTIADNVAAFASYADVNGGIYDEVEKTQRVILGLCAYIDKNRNIH